MTPSTEVFAAHCASRHDARFKLVTNIIGRFCVKIQRKTFKLEIPSSDQKLWVWGIILSESRQFDNRKAHLLHQTASTDVKCADQWR
jgi:hypothetical protein